MSVQDDRGIQAALDKFKNLQGTTAYVLRDTSYQGLGPFVDHEWNADGSLFCASAFKVFVLAAYLHYAERGQLPPGPQTENQPSSLTEALAEPLAVEKADHAQSSRVFGQMTGTTIANAILDAMIAYSDNTATDIAMKRVSVAKVRELMYGLLGLDKKAVRIPDSTKAFADYLNGGPGRRLINDEETMVCTARAFEQFYKTALNKRGTGLFDKEETRRQFERVMTTATPIPLVIPENRLCYMKGGQADFNGEHAMTTTGMMFTGNATVAFALLYNWEGQDNFVSGVNAYIDACRGVFAAVEALVGK